MQKKSHLVYDFEAIKFPEKYLEFLPKGLHFINNSSLFWEHLEKNNLKTSDMINISSAFVDPVQFVKDKLKIAGVSEENINENKTDTFTDKRYHSYRRDYPKHGLMLSYVMMKNMT